MKNTVSNFTAAATGANTSVVIATAVDSAVTTGAAQVTKGCKIYQIFVELWVYASAAVAVGVTSGIDMYIWKNTGNNLTAPIPGTQGTSNEKRWVFFTMKGLTGARTEGSPPYTIRRWLKVPKSFQRMATDDQLQLIIRPTGANALVCNSFVYKWHY